MSLLIRALAAAGPVLSLVSAASAGIVYNSDLSYHDLAASVELYGHVEDGVDQYAEYIMPGSFEDTFDLTHTFSSGASGSAMTTFRAAESAAGFHVERHAIVSYTHADADISLFGGGDSQYRFTVDEATPFRLEALIEVDETDSFSSVDFSFWAGDETIVDQWVVAPDNRLDLTGENAVTGTLLPGVEYGLLMQMWVVENSEADVQSFANATVSLTVPEPAGVSLLALAGPALLRRRRA